MNHYPTPNTEYTVQGLTEGSRYDFRIIAVNEAGPGKPSKPSNSIVAKVQKCKSSFFAVFFFSFFLSLTVVTYAFG